MDILKNKLINTKLFLNKSGLSDEYKNNIYEIEKQLNKNIDIFQIKRLISQLDDIINKINIQKKPVIIINEYDYTNNYSFSGGDDIKHDDYKKKIEDLESKIKLIEIEKKELEKKLTKVEYEKKELETKLSDYADSEIKEKLAEINRLKYEIEELKNNIKDKEHKIEEYLLDLSRCREELKKCNEENTRLKSELDMIKEILNKVNILDSKIEDIQNKINTLDFLEDKKVINPILDKINILIDEKKIFEDKKVINQILEKINILMDEKIVLSEKINILSKQISALEYEIKKHIDEAKHIDVDGLKKQIDDLKREKELLQNQLKEKDILSKRINELEDEIKKHIDEAKHIDVDGLKKQIDDLKREKELLQNQLDEKTRQYNELNNQLQICRDKLKLCEKNNKTILDNLNNQIDDINMILFTYDLNHMKNLMNQHLEYNKEIISYMELEIVNQDPNNFSDWYDKYIVNILNLETLNKYEPEKYTDPNKEMYITKFQKVITDYKNYINEQINNIKSQSEFILLVSLFSKIINYLYILYDNFGDIIIKSIDRYNKFKNYKDKLKIINDIFNKTYNNPNILKIDYYSIIKKINTFLEETLEIKYIDNSNLITLDNVREQINKLNIEIKSQVQTRGGNNIQNGNHTIFTNLGYIILLILIIYIIANLFCKKSHNMNVQKNKLNYQKNKLNYQKNKLNYQENTLNYQKNKLNYDEDNNNYYSILASKYKEVYTTYI